MTGAIRRLGLAILGGGGAAMVLAGGLTLADRLCPPDLTRLATPSRIVVARDGTMLRAFMTADQQWRFPVTRIATGRVDVASTYLDLLLDVEDKRFWTHPGVDLLALARATGQLVTQGRVVSGGSTLTMQVARLLEPRRRTFLSKIIQIARAIQLERRMSKTDILEAYLTLTPMGGNLQGVRAGSLAWFGKEPAQLSQAEAALLVALPQAPRTTRPDAPASRAEERRAKILRMAAKDGLIGPAALDDALASPLPRARLPMPLLAPHLAERLAANEPSGVIATTVDRTIQQGVQRVLHQTLDEIPRPVNLAALVVDWRTGAVLAAVGSGDYFDASRKGAIDMTATIRSPGSTLKPFIYGMAFDGLLAHPGSLVRDGPTRFDDYAPHNFDGGFNGDVTVRRALQASLNLPAVIVLQRLGPVAFAARFKEAGLPLVFNAGTTAPSLPMALGGVGMSLHDLVTAYAALANGGTVNPLFEQPDARPRAASGAAALMTRAGADAVVDILADMPAPKGTARRSTIAYKTGTSYRFRDGWAVGFDGSRVIGVWMGRADGGTCMGCVGMASAGILFRLFDLLAPDPLPRRTLAPIFAGPPPAALIRLTTGIPTPVVGAPHITFPLQGSHLLVDAGSPGDDAVTLAVDGGKKPFRWLVDGQPVASRPFARDAAWHPAGEGFSTVTVMDAGGRTDEVNIRIERRGTVVPGWEAPASVER